MFSWSLGADIEDEERMYFKANVFPEVGLPQPIQLCAVKSSLWTSKLKKKTLIDKYMG